MKWPFEISIRPSNWKTNKQTKIQTKGKTNQLTRKNKTKKPKFTTPNKQTKFQPNQTTNFRRYNKLGHPHSSAKNILSNTCRKSFKPLALGLSQSVSSLSTSLCSVWKCYVKGQKNIWNLIWEEGILKGNRYLVKNSLWNKNELIFFFIIMIST